MAKKHEKRNLDAGMMKYPGRCKLQNQPDDDEFVVAAALMIIDLLTKPLNSGKADMEAAPTMQKRQVRGIVL